MIISTTSQLEGRPIAEYLGVVSAESVQGINFVRDFFTRVRDVLGGRSQTLESALREAREQATEELKARAQQLRADAVVGVDTRSACLRYKAAWSSCLSPAPQCACAEGRFATGRLPGF